MHPGYYRTQTPLQRSPGPMPRWARSALMWTAVALGVMVVSRAVTVASIDDVGPPPAVLAQAN